MRKNRIIIFDSDYPDLQSNSPGDEFVRSRAKEYKRRGFSIEIIGISSDKNNNEYSLDGINVSKFNSKDQVFRRLDEMTNDEILFIHFIPFWLVDKIVRKNLQCFVWVHGWEALGWHRRLYLVGDKGFVKYILGNIRQLFNLRKLIKHSNNSGIVSFIFVSKWMKRVAQADMFIKIKRSYIIPNPIEGKFIQNESEGFPDVLVIRSFENRKYATDMITQFILLVSKRNANVKFHVFGRGKYWEKDTKPLESLQNVNLYNRFLNKNEILEAHKKASFFLCPTRQDAQGVSMCEAMGSGLIPITNPSTAIPEFVIRQENAICESSIEEMAIAFLELYENRGLRESYQLQAKEYVASHLMIETIVNKELCLLKQ